MEIKKAPLARYFFNSYKKLFGNWRFRIAQVPPVPNRHNHQMVKSLINNKNFVLIIGNICGFFNHHIV